MKNIVDFIDDSTNVQEEQIVENAKADKFLETYVDKNMDAVLDLLGNSESTGGTDCTGRIVEPGDWVAFPIAGLNKGLAVGIVYDVKANINIIICDNYRKQGLRYGNTGAMYHQNKTISRPGSLVIKLGSSKDFLKMLQRG